MMETIIIKLNESTPLSCSVYNPQTDKPCGKPATVAYAYERKTQTLPRGMWLIQPVCRECTMKVNAVYER